MASKRYTVTRVSGQRPQERRAVAFLECDTDPEINAKAVFDRMKEKNKNDVQHRFDHWIGFGVHDHWHHGWRGHPRYGECYSFRWYQRKARHRFYGFLFHPTPETNGRFQICVLVSHAAKFQQETDRSQLERAVAFRSDQEVVAAIRKVFPESKKPRNPKWTIH